MKPLARRAVRVYHTGHTLALRGTRPASGNLIRFRALLIRLDEKDPRPLYQQIVDEVRRGVVIGALVPGDALSSVRQLAAELRVNPTTVQQAYRELEREGLVHVRRGQGTYVTELASGSGARERRRLKLMVARRALRDARRHGFEADELVDAIRRVARRKEGRSS